MVRVLIVAGLAALAFAVYALVDCALADRRSVRGLPRWAWLLVILVLPVVGGVLWFLIGSGRAEPAPRPRVIGPDDDPAFLRSRPGARPSGGPRVPADDERIARLEQELARLDPDADQDDEGDARR